MASADVFGQSDRSLLAALRRHLVVVVGCVLAAACLAGVASAFQSSVYEATAEVLLEVRSTDPVTGAPVNADPARVMQTEVQVAMSRQVQDLARRKLGADAPAISAVPAGQSDVLRIKAVGENSARTARVANAYAEAYIDFRRNQTRAELTRAQDDVNRQLRLLEQQAAKARGAQRELLIAEQTALRQRRDSLTSQLNLVSGRATILNRALAPDSPISPNPARNVVLGGIAGLVVGVLVSLVMDRRSFAPVVRPALRRRSTEVATTASAPKTSDGAYVEHPNRVIRWVGGEAVPDPRTDGADVTVWFRLDPKHADPPAWEGLLARMVHRDRAVVLAIPVFTSQVSFGDEVRVVPVQTGPLVATEVTVPGGNATFRVQFAEWMEPAGDPRRQALLSRLAALECSFDIFTPRLMAVSVSVVSAGRVDEALEEAQDRGELVYLAAQGAPSSPPKRGISEGPLSSGSSAG